MTSIFLTIEKKRTKWVVNDERTNEMNKKSNLPISSGDNHESQNIQKEEIISFCKTNKQTGIPKQKLWYCDKRCWIWSNITIH